jgi:hypothetical protein
MSIELALPAARQRPLMRALAWLASWRGVLVWAVASRIVVFVGALVVHLVRPHGYFPASTYRSLQNVLGAWDGRWYRMVAAQGYSLVPGHKSDVAFFPLYAFVLRGMHALGLGLVTSGIVVSNILFLVGLLAFAELTTMLFSKEDARRACIWVCVFPLGFVFSMAYPTSLVFAALALSMIFALRGRWLTAAVLVAVASLARPEGMFLALPLAALALSRRRELSGSARGRALAAVVAGPLAVAGFLVYLAVAFDNIRAWSTAEAAWGRSFRLGGILDAFAQLPADIRGHPWLVRDLGFLVAYVLLLAVAVRLRIGAAWIAAAALLVVLPLTSGTVESDGRFGMVGFAFYWPLARAIRKPWLERGLWVVSLGLLAWWTVALPLANP